MQLFFSQRFKACSTLLSKRYSGKWQRLIAGCSEMATPKLYRSIR